MSTPSTQRIHIGTSGWYYPEWRGCFYPEKLPKTRWFAHYVTAFSVVEVNNTFYRLPTADSFRQWADRAPAGFIYALKAPRDLTHRYDTDRKALLQTFADGALSLGDHLGPVLYQFPPWLARNLAYLTEFLQNLPVGFDHVMEFRHPSWYEPEVQRLLKSADVGFCVHDMHGSASPEWRTSPVAYLRLHGPTRRKYVGRYGPARLREIGDRLLSLAKGARSVYCFFNNTADGAAVADALELQERFRMAEVSSRGA